MELMLFKDSVLQKEKEDIFRDSYKIEIFVNLYEILLVHTENLRSGMIRELLGLSFAYWIHFIGNGLTGKTIFMRNLGNMHVMNWKRSQEK